MITEQQLFDLGFIRLGDDEEDPYYYIVFKEPLNGNRNFSGNLDERGFELYAVPKIFTAPEQITRFMEACGLEVDAELTARIKPTK